MVVSSRLEEERSNAVAAVGSRQLGSRQDGDGCVCVLQCSIWSIRNVTEASKKGERILRMLLEWSEDVLQDFGPAAGWRKESRG